MSILLVHNNTQIRETLAFMLETHFSVNVYQARDCGESGRAIFQRLSREINLVIHERADYKKANFTSFIQTIEKTPRIVLASAGARITDAGVVGVVDTRNLVESLFLTLSDLVARKRLDLHPQGIGYFPISLDLLLQMNPLKGDLYIRIPVIRIFNYATKFPVPDDGHYIKVFHGGDLFSSEDLNKYLNIKKVKYLYITKLHTRKFVESLNEHITQVLKKKNLDLDDTEELLISVFDMVHQVSRVLDFDEQLVELSSKAVEMTLRVVRQNGALENLIKKIKDHPELYIANHSLIMAHIACGIAKMLDWSSDTTYEKLCFAALLHDITLDNQELAKLRTLEDLSRAENQFTDVEIKKFRDHPFKASEIAVLFSEIPKDVATIILQHHERPDATGFPKRLSVQNLHQLSVVFIIAHEIVDNVLVHGMNFQQLYFELSKICKSGIAKKILNAIQKPL